MNEQNCDFSPIDSSLLQKYDSNFLFSDAFRTSYLYNSPSTAAATALYVNSPLGLANNFSNNQGFPSQNSFGAVALNVLNSMSMNVLQNSFHMNPPHTTHLNDKPPPVFCEPILTEEMCHIQIEKGKTERPRREENNMIFRVEPQTEHYASHRIDQSRTTPTNIAASNNIIIKGSKSMNFTNQHNFVLQQHLLHDPKFSLPSISLNPNSIHNYFSQLDESYLSAHQNYPLIPFSNQVNVTLFTSLIIGLPFPIIKCQDNQNSLTPLAQSHPQSSVNQNSSLQNNPSSSVDTAGLKTLHATAANTFYDSPRNFNHSFQPYTPTIAPPIGCAGFSSFLLNSQLPIPDMHSLKLSFLPDQDDYSPYQFAATPVHDIEQKQQKLQQKQMQQHQQFASQQLQQQKNNLNLLQQQQYCRQMQRYYQEKNEIQKQQIKLTEEALQESHRSLQYFSSTQQQIQLQPQQQSQQKQSQHLNILNVSHQVSPIQNKQVIPIQKLPLSLAEEPPKVQKSDQTNKHINEITIHIFEEEDKQKSQQKQDITNQQEEHNQEEEEVDNQNEEEEEEEEQIQIEEEQEACVIKKQSKRTRQSKNNLNIANTKLSSQTSIKIQPNANPIYNSHSIKKKQINETKNIPKNYSKAIIAYIQKHPHDCSRLLGKHHTFKEFEQFLIEKKERMTSIKDLRSLWTTDVDDKSQLIFNRVFRILSFKFFREDAVSYIYSSRKIKNTRAQITYRSIFQRALYNPSSFSFMKLQN